MSARFTDYPRITDPDLADRIRQIEGGDWPQCLGYEVGDIRDDSSSGRGRPAVDVWREYRRRVEQEVSDPKWRERLLTKELTGISINGFGGWNRYHVYGDGIVAFSTGHAGARGQLEEARKAGFWIGPRP